MVSFVIACREGRDGLRTAVVDEVTIARGVGAVGDRRTPVVTAVLVGRCSMALYEAVVPP